METVLVRVTEPRTVTWAGANDSNPISLKGKTTGLQLILDANFTGTTLTYKTRQDANSPWVPVQKAGSSITDTVTGSLASCNVLDAADLFGLTELIITSNNSETCTGTLLITA
jgi:hypothetical protein